MKDDVIILAIAAAAAWAIIKFAAPASVSIKRKDGNLEIPRLFTTGGGWRPNGTYDPNLLDTQYREGWGYGD